MVKQSLEQTTHHQQQQEVLQLRENIEKLKKRFQECKEIEAKRSKKAKELEATMKDMKGHKDKQLKQADSEVKAMRAAADKSKKEWEEYETLNFKIAEPKKAIETAIESIGKLEETIVQLKNIREERAEQLKVIKDELAENTTKQEELKSQISEYELYIQKQSHEVKKLLDEYTNTKAKKTTTQKPETSDSSSDEEQRPVQKCTPKENKQIKKVEKKPAYKSDSSSEDSEDSELSSNSSDDEKQTKPTPTRKETTKSSSSESGSGEDEKEKSPPRPASKMKSTTDEEKLLMRMETSKAQRNLRSFAETKKLKKASSNTIDISKVISDKDEVYFMKVTKKLDPQLLTGLEISLDEAEKFTIGIDHYKSIVGTKVKELMLLSQCDNKYALQNVSLSGCVTINEDHPVEILNYTFESEEDEKISVPSETLKKRHPLFGADYVDKITLDNDVIAKFDGLIETLKKKYEKKDKSLKKEEQSKVEHEEIFNILNSHVPGKKEKMSASGGNSKAAFENDSIAQVLKSPIQKKKDRRKSIMINDSTIVSENNESLNVLKSPPRKKKDRRKSNDVSKVINVENKDNSNVLKSYTPNKKEKNDSTTNIETGDENVEKVLKIKKEKKDSTTNLETGDENVEKVLKIKKEKNDSTTNIETGDENVEKVLNNEKESLVKRSMNNISIEKKLKQSSDDHSAKRKKKKSDVLEHAKITDTQVTPHKIKKKIKSETESNSKYRNRIEISEVVRKKKKYNI